MSTSRGRPPRLLCLAGGIIGATMAHCSSVRSEGYIFRDRFSFNIIAHSSTDGICANYLTNLLLCQSLFPDSLLVMDGSVVGRDCTALMIHVIYKGRALPLAWRVRQGPKGHFPEDLHIAVVALMREVIPEGAQVVFLGDGEFDGTALQATLNEAGWSYTCRTALSTVATWEGTTFRLDTLGACSKPGTLIALQEVKFTRSAYGPVMVLSGYPPKPGHFVSSITYRQGLMALPGQGQCI